MAERVGIYMGGMWLIHVTDERPAAEGKRRGHLVEGTKGRLWVSEGGGGEEGREGKLPRGGLDLRVGGTQQA